MDCIEKPGGRSRDKMTCSSGLGHLIWPFTHQTLDRVVCLLLLLSVGLYHKLCSGEQFNMYKRLAESMPVFSEGCINCCDASFTLRNGNVSTIITEIQITHLIGRRWLNLICPENDKMLVSKHWIKIYQLFSGRV